MQTKGRKGGVLEGNELTLERKIVALEQRLVLVERFVEMRFCESFRDFSIRNGNSAAFESTGTNRVGTLSNITNKPESHDRRTRKGTKIDEEVERSGAEQRTEVDNGVTSSSRATRSSRRRQAVLARKSEPPPVPQIKSGISVHTPKELRINVVRYDGEVQSSGLDEAEDGTNISEVEVQEEVVVKVATESGNEEEDDGADDYFSFPGNQSFEVEDSVEDADDNVADDDDPLGANSMDPDDNDWSEAEEEEKPRPAKRKRKAASPSSSIASTPKKGKRRGRIRKSSKIIADISDLKPSNVKPGSTKECPLCHKHWKVELFDKHMADSHMRERHLTCRYCEKTFFNKPMRYKHEKRHQVEKYGKKCRVEGCDKVYVDSNKALIHERACIRRRLEANLNVDPEVLEDVKKRSQHVDLKWPGEEKGNFCNVCKKSIPQEIKMEEHIKEHANWKCTLCEEEKVFLTKYRLMRHMKGIHGKKDDDQMSGTGTETEAAVEEALENQIENPEGINQANLEQTLQNQADVVS